jgi:hypothetical protein
MPLLEMVSVPTNSSLRFRSSLSPGLSEAVLALSSVRHASASDVPLLASLPEALST